jgi:hypothetical protein
LNFVGFITSTDGFRAGTKWRRGIVFLARRRYFKLVDSRCWWLL